MSAEAAVDPGAVAARATRRHLVAIAELSVDELRDLVELALEIKRRYLGGEEDKPLAGRVLAMVFEHPSLRTRVSFEVGMYQLGGHAMYLAPQEVQLGKRETIPDAARVLSRMVQAIMIRTGGHERVVELARHATVPVINGLSEQEHPCQALADVLTIREHRGATAGLRLAYLGDGNNVCVSLMHAAARLGIRMTIACPAGYTPPAHEAQAAAHVAKKTGGRVEVTNDPRAAVRGADVVYTDVWTSMGQERESANRRVAFAGYQVNGALMKSAGDAVVMHCLPAHRGEEITDDVIESPNSIVFDQAENRVHAQKAVLCRLLT
jgi:ornithine carbamoyltransferase